VDPLLETDNANDSDFQSKIAQQTTDRLRAFFSSRTDIGDALTPLDLVSPAGTRVPFWACG
jgi:hypothetical protein